MYSRDEEETLLELLTMLQRLHTQMSSLSIDELATQRYGICYHLNRNDNYGLDHEEELKELFALWPASTGDEDYPVPGVEGENPWKSYVLARSGVHGMWVGPYGQYRWELLNWLINYLKEQLNEPAHA